MLSRRASQRSTTAGPHGTGSGVLRRGSRRLAWSMGGGHWPGPAGAVRIGSVLVIVNSQTYNLAEEHAASA